MEIEKKESEENDTKQDKHIPPRGGRRRSFDRDLTKGSIIGNLWTLTWPTTISGTIFMLGPMIDMIWVGSL